MLSFKSSSQFCNLKIVFHLGIHLTTVQGRNHLGFTFILWWILLVTDDKFHTLYRFHTLQGGQKIPPTKSLGGGKRSAWSISNVSLFAMCCISDKALHSIIAQSELITITGTLKLAMLSFLGACQFNWLPTLHLWDKWGYFWDDISMMIRW
jgi:hypothetical protein